MDKYGQIGPDKGEYDHDVALVANSLTAGIQAVSVILAHRGTRMQLLLASKEHTLVFGGDPLYDAAGVWVFLAVQEHGAHWFRIDTIAHTSYLREKLGVTEADAETISDFLVRLGHAMGLRVEAARSTVEVVDAG
jgi:acetylornithine/succinyldiaminopimelate/putrescine aminotransferase